MKTHLLHGGCGRSKRTTTNYRHVDCLLCKATPVYTEMKANGDAAAAEAFEAQIPRRFIPQFGAELVCECGSDLFRYKGRSCYGHYDDYQCAACRKETSRLTETGMCF